MIGITCIYVACAVLYGGVLLAVTTFTGAVSLQTIERPALAAFVVVVALWPLSLTIQAVLFAVGMCLGRRGNHAQ